jgi:RNA polymerase sigma factor (sigma-70 family)
MTTSRITCEVARSDHARLDAKSRFGRGDDISTAVHDAAAGDARAWSLIVKRFDATVRSVARRHGLSETDRDEVAQRTWLALVRHVARLEGHPSLGGWLALTARRECLRLLAGSRREPPIGELTTEAADDETPHEHLELEERREALRRAIARTPEHERRLMGLLLQEPALSYDQISAMLKIPKGSIGPTRGRCIARLRGDVDLARAINGWPAPGHDLA